MRKIYTTIVFVFTLMAAKAQFSGAYAPDRWTTMLSSGSNGTVDISGAPSSIIIRGSDGGGGSDVDIDYTITVTTSGNLSFNWSYHTNDMDASPAYDLAGFLINGVFTQLSNDAGPIDQSGSYSAGLVSAGSVIGFRVRATDNTMGDATFTISGFSAPGGVLPLRLQSFTARRQFESIRLQWSSSEEENVSHYELQRSADGINYSLLANMAARNGDSQEYDYLDAIPHSNANYYRLKMVDKDGSYSYSHIVTVQSAANTSIRIHPVPAQSQLHIRAAAANVGKEVFRIYDAAGRLVHTHTATILQGEVNTIINISGLVKGWYFITAQSSGKTERFSKE
jgi:hypothetical protein